MTESNPHSIRAHKVQRIIIGYTPFENKENAYTERSVEILSRIGEVCKVPSIRDFLSNPLYWKPRGYDFIIANWIENSIVNRKGSLSAVGILKLALTIVQMKAISKKIIFVRHNNYPHSASPKTGPRAARIIDLAEFFFDNVITHSGHNANSKKTYIPHPLYKKPEIIQPIHVGIPEHRDRSFRSIVTDDSGRT